MKVISGLLKGRNIEGFNIEGTRPTMDRVKESIFSTIQFEIRDSIVLDLFAGSGNLGIEAISNGATKCYFVDNNKVAINTINKTNFVLRDGRMSWDLRHSRCIPEDSSPIRSPFPLHLRLWWKYSQQ